jgi:predicted nuclease of predicted toxin-antitoxin system
VGTRSRLAVITHDLDFSAILASTEALGPSVIQVRTQDVLPDAIGSDVVRVLRDQRAALDQGAIVSVDQLTSRVRVLPIRKG